MLEKENTEAKEDAGAGPQRAARFPRSGKEIPRGPYWLLMAERDSARDGHAALDGIGGGSRGGFRGDVFLLGSGTDKVLPRSRL